MDAFAENRVDAVGVLSDRLRGEIYGLVAASDSPLSRDDVAAAASVPRSTAAFHLDRLADAGLVTVEHRRLSGRSGPGAGRPAKLYRAAHVDVIASMPERHYELVGELFAAAIERAEREGTTVRDAVSLEARALGLALGRAQPSLEDALTRCGYSPSDDGTGRVTLENCPFHALATRHTPLVCGANLSLVEGLVDATGDERTPRLDAAAGRCCVAIDGAPAA
ncbi:helix-turn-helix transcriptional regulator [Microbacterium flavescens]|jgi:predicted ArsR family transcriptional regulator|uniref:helix-turn-helix transcriptional regulator n=1 Tax=Microbacterium flavescens TaxID=69366 RepID=UPI001BDDD1C7|nr:helix-turn-helix domain-containing protein [Microbacterium flavescens]BFF12321.1 helix-turn-helix domain-containing protein [Microbacterium flavescens]